MTRGTLVCCVGAGALDSPFVGHGRRSAGGAYPKGHLAPPLRGTGAENPFRQRRALHAAATSALRCPKNAAHIRLLAFFDRCGNSGFASERLAAFAVPGPVSRRPANGAAAEIPVTLFLPPAARNRNPATGSAKPQFPRRGRQARDRGHLASPLGGIGEIPICRQSQYHNSFMWRSRLASPARGGAYAACGIGGGVAARPLSQLRFAC